MKSLQILHQWLLLLLFSTAISATPFDTPRLSPFRRTVSEESNTVSGDFRTFFYTQTLDHFNYRPQSYATFKQRYVMNSKYWGGPKENAPIFVYLGAEAPLDRDLANIGFLTDNAARFKALLVYIEHRFYGQSNPLGSIEKALENDNMRGYFNSAQALADYAEVLVYLKKKLHAQNSPIIVVGGSYGGMLAAWFRLKYPHITLGALASSAPILYFDDITPQSGFYSVVTKDFKDASESCYQTIRKSWSEIDKVASKPNGLSVLSQTFKTCTTLEQSSDLRDYLDSIYSEAAQYDEPPTYPVAGICGGIDGGLEGDDILGRIFAGVVAYKGKRSCYDINEYNYPSETKMGWAWQQCSEMVMPIGRGMNDTMFPPEPFNLNGFMTDCKSLFGVRPRPHWVTTYYGGQDMKLVLQRYASNIIFSNGLRDPYSSGGVLEDISSSILSVQTTEGSHCLDIVKATQSDPQWLIMQRKIEIEIIEGWIRKHYADLRLLKQ
ncbi:unnamed protein product [Ilex paraguariensis]|uniref:Lysosomal Pro-X carboxypeptidase n=1 Tax=Ilex paraguariensis TaxID=185542 RepID=A0ABC8V0C2_9AQUA